MNFWISNRHESSSTCADLGALPDVHAHRPIAHHSPHPIIGFGPPAPGFAAWGIHNAPFFPSAVPHPPLPSDAHQCGTGHGGGIGQDSCARQGRRAVGRQTSTPALFTHETPAQGPNLERLVNFAGLRAEGVRVRTVWPVHGDLTDYYNLILGQCFKRHTRGSTVPIDPPPGVIALQSQDEASEPAGSHPFVAETAESRASNVCKSISSSRLFHNSNSESRGVKFTTDDDEVQSKRRPRHANETLTDLAKLDPDDPSLTAEDNPLEAALLKPLPRRFQAATLGSRRGIQNPRESRTCSCDL